MPFTNMAFVDQVGVAAFDPATAATLGEVRSLTHNAAVKFRISASADGKRLSYSAFGGLESPLRQIRGLDVGSGAESSFPIRTASIGIPHYLSPDGSILAYSEDSDEKPVSYLASPDGAAPRRICEACTIAGVFPGAKSVLIRENAAWLKLDLDPARRTPVFSQPPGARVREVHLSADGSWLVVLLDKGAANAVYALPLADLPVKQESWVPALDEPGWVSCPRMTPDGKWLVYYSDRDGDSCVWARRFDAAAHKATGDPHAVLHQHTNYFWYMAPRFSLFLEVARDKLFVPSLEVSGNIWMTQPDLRK
jgi:hypothetical protein